MNEIAKVQFKKENSPLTLRASPCIEYYGNTNGFPHNADNDFGNDSMEAAKPRIPPPETATPNKRDGTCPIYNIPKAAAPDAGNGINPVYPITPEEQQNLIEEQERIRQKLISKSKANPPNPHSFYGDCWLRLVNNRHYVNRDGYDDESNENELVIAVYHNEDTLKHLGDISVPYSRISTIHKLVERKFPQIVFDPNAIKQHTVEIDIRSQIQSAPVTEIHTQAGWNVENGKYHYVFKNAHLPMHINTDLNMPYYEHWGRNQLKCTWDAIYNLYTDRGIAIILSLFVFSGATYKLFELAGYPLQSLLFLTGRTGCMKTSIAKALYTHLARDENRKYPRRIDMDTGASFERGLVEEGYDTVTLFDDFAPPKNPRAKSTLDNNFEAIVRMIGDGSTKSRSNRKLENCRGKGVHGSVVITGELQGEGLSSNLRCLYINLVREQVNLDALTYLQKNEYAVNSLIKHFTDYLSKSWDTHLNVIRNDYPKLRHDIQSKGIFAHQRSAERYIYFTLLENIIESFLHSCRLVERYADLGEYFYDCSSDIINVLASSENASLDCDPCLVFISAFESLISLGKLKISPSKPTAKELMIWDGFEDSEFIYCLEENLFSKVRDSLQNTLTPYYLSLKETKKLLSDGGYTVPCSNGKNKVTYSSRINIAGMNQKIDFIKFRKSKLSSFSENARNT